VTPLDTVEHIPYLERLFPYRGAWHTPWVIMRYFRTIIPALTPARALNAVRAFAEMKLGIRRVGSRPFVLRVEPCNVCNLLCPLCACGTGLDPRPKGFMTLEDFRRVLEENRMAFLLRLDGMGESTLHPRLAEMIRAAKSFGLAVTIHSNFNTPACSRPELFLDSGLDRLVVDIDGATQETYARYRVGGDLELTVSNLRRLVEARRRRGRRRPIIEVQFIEFEWNLGELPAMRRLVRQWGADKLTICSPDRTTREARFNPAKPRRCFWLWTALTVGWDLGYRSCTNAWSPPWPRLNLRETPSPAFWNHPLMRQARQYNLDKSPRIIAEDAGCKCRRCNEMLCAPLTDPYFCE